MKRFYAVVLSIFLLFVFTGCENKEDSGNNGECSITLIPAQPIYFNTLEETLTFFKENDLESYTYEEKEKYSEMMSFFRAKGTIPVLSTKENINITRVALDPKLPGEDIGICYGFLYNGKYYAITFYFIDSAFSDFALNGIASYETARFGSSYSVNSQNIDVDFMQNKYDSLIEKTKNGRIFIRFILDETYYVRVTNNVNTYEEMLDMLRNIEISTVSIL